MRERRGERGRERGRERDRLEGENSNSKTLILKDSSVRFIWTYLTASPERETERERDRQTNRQADRQRQGWGADNETDR